MEDKWRSIFTEKSDLALMAWAQEAKIEACHVQTSPINIKKLISEMPEIRKMTLIKPKEFCPLLRSDLNECGIALVFLPHLKGSFLHGATFLDGKKIVVGMTARGKDADKFWFSLFHELAHIVLSHIGQPNGTTEDDEKKLICGPETFLYRTMILKDFKNLFGMQKIKERRKSIGN